MISHASPQLDEIVRAVDEARGPVLLVGHSAGCGMAHHAVDARPDKVARAVHIGGFPAPEGDPLLPRSAGQGPFPNRKPSSSRP